MASHDGSTPQPPEDRSNDLVTLLLGTLKLLEDFAAALEGSATSAPSKFGRAEEPVLAAAVGLLSLRRTVLRWADLACTDDAAPLKTAAQRPSSSLTSLLR